MDRRSTDKLREALSTARAARDASRVSVETAEALALRRVEELLRDVLRAA